MTKNYRMMILWSEEDRAFLVSLPELYGGGRYCTHGKTYEEAAKNGRKVIDLLAETYRSEGRELPAPTLAPA